MSKRKQDDFLILYKAVHDDFERFCRARAYYDMPYEDLMNETLLVAYEKIDQLKNKSSFLSFLIGISIRVLANSRRKKRAIAIDFENHQYQNYPVQQDDVARFSDVELLHFALSKLPEQQREAIILFEITGFSIKEIMEIQNSGTSAVKQRLARGRKELLRILSQIEKRNDGMKQEERLKQLFKAAKEEEAQFSYEMLAKQFKQSHSTATILKKLISKAINMNTLFIILIGGCLSILWYNSPLHLLLF